MFKSIYSQGYSSNYWSGATSIKGLFRYSYIIVDDDFSGTYFGYCDQTLYNPLVRCGALIDAYQTQMYNNPGTIYNIAYNLYLYHMYMKENHSWYELESEIEYNILHTPEYKKYADDIKKYIKRVCNLKAFW